MRRGLVRKRKEQCFDAGRSKRCYGNTSCRLYSESNRYICGVHSLKSRNIIVQSLNKVEGRETTESAPPAGDVSLGIFTVVSLILLLWGFCWLKSYSSLTPPQRINVIFQEIAGLNENAAVYVDGVRVGMVDKMQWQEQHRVLVRLRINHSTLKVPIGSKFEILTNGIVGAKYVQIDLPPKQPDQKSPPLLTDEAIVRGEDPSDGISGKQAGDHAERYRHEKQVVAELQSGSIRLSVPPTNWQFLLTKPCQ